MYVYLELGYIEKYVPKDLAVDRSKCPTLNVVIDLSSLLSLFFKIIFACVNGCLLLF